MARKLNVVSWHHSELWNSHVSLDTVVWTALLSHRWVFSMFSSNDIELTPSSYCNHIALSLRVAPHGLVRRQRHRQVCLFSSHQNQGPLKNICPTPNSCPVIIKLETNIRLHWTYSHTKAKVNSPVSGGKVCLLDSLQNTVACWAFLQIVVWPSDPHSVLGWHSPYLHGHEYTWEQSNQENVW